MNDLRKAAEMALKYFEDAHGLENTEVEIKEALRQALTKPEMKELTAHDRYQERQRIAQEQQRVALAQPEQEQKTPLKVLNLTVFTGNRLRNGRVYDVETLQTMTNRDILAIPDMGKKALKEVLEALAAYASDMSQDRVDETVKGKHEWVGLDGEIPGLGLVTDEFYNGMIVAEDILRERNT